MLNHPVLAKVRLRQEKAVKIVSQWLKLIIRHCVGRRLAILLAVLLSKTSFKCDQSNEFVFHFCVVSFLRGELSYVDLLNESTREIIPDQNAKWRSFTHLNSDKAHKKIIYDISCFNETLITLSLDRLVNSILLNIGRSRF